MDLKSEIIRRVEALPVELQRQFLVYVEGLEHSRPPGENGSTLVSSLSGLDDASAAEMTKAIEAACEGVDPREW